MFIISAELTTNSNWTFFYLARKNDVNSTFGSNTYADRNVRTGLIMGGTTVHYYSQWFESSILQVSGLFYT